MKFNTLVKTTLSVSAALALAACGNSGASSSSAATSGSSAAGSSTSSSAAATGSVLTEVSNPTTVTFWHAMSGGQEEALTKLTEDFMAANPNIKIELQNQGKYNELQAKINSTLTSPSDLPTITQAYPGWLFAASQEELLVDLTPYVSDATIGYTADTAIRPELLEGAKINGVQYGIPFNKSTEALFYNADLLKEYGVEVPTTLEELKTAAETIWEKSGQTVVGAGFDSLNNYYAIGLKNKGVDFNKDLDLTSDASKEVVNYYEDGIKAGYFRTAGSDKYLSGPFQNKQVAMFVGSTAGEAYVSKGAAETGFEYGVAVRPEAINLQQGTDIYMFDSASEEQRTAAFLYMKYLTSAESQLYWAQQTGYLPVIASVMESDEYKNGSSKVAAIAADLTKELFSIPVEENADAAYNETRTILENIFATPDANVDEMLKASVDQFTSVWNQ